MEGREGRKDQNIYEELKKREEGGKQWEGRQVAAAQHAQGRMKQQQAKAGA